MQLSDILESSSAKEISKKTNISQGNIEALLAGDFGKLKKVKTLGFISILEREYKIKLDALKKEALTYYDEYKDEESIAIAMPVPKEKRGKSKWFLFFVLALLVSASWYFFTQFDKKQLSELLPFSEEQISKMLMPKIKNIKEELNIEKEIDNIQPEETPKTDNSAVTEVSETTGTEIKIESVDLPEDTNRSSI